MFSTRRCGLSPIALATLLLVTVTASARAWSRDPFSPTAVAPGTTNSQVVASAISDGSGGCYVVLQETVGGYIRPYAQHLDANGSIVPGWSNTGLPGENFSGNANYIHGISDGSGGVLFAWAESHTGHLDIYAQHYTANGTLAPGWSASGIPVSVNSTDKVSLSVCTDGAGGMIIVYQFNYSTTDHDIYISRVTGSGVVTAAAIATNTADQTSPLIASDGLGGAFIVYHEGPSGGSMDLRGAHVNGTLSILSGNIAICSNSGDQYLAGMVSDGAGGAYVSWYDYNPGYANPPHTFVTHLSASGAPEAIYGSVGVLLSDPNTGTYAQGLSSDGQNGAYVWWYYNTGSSPMMATHAGPHATIYPGWGATGTAVASTSGGGPTNWAACDDGSGGGYFAWTRYGGGYTLYATHFSPYGVQYPSIPFSGRAVGESFSSFNSGRLIPDGNGGAIYVYDQYQYNGAYEAAFAIHLDAYAMLGDDRPTSAGVADIPADQGGKVRFTWNASPYDNTQERGVGSYWVWRQAPISMAQAAVAAGTGAWLGEGASTPRVVARPGEATPTRFFRRNGPLAVSDYAWEYLTSMPAHQTAQYSYVATTTNDSTSGHNPRTVFMVEAHAAVNDAAFWASDPDSGYSVDNLAPATPAPFTARYSAGSTALHWGANTETDLAGYRLYRGSSTGFVPGPGNLVSAQPDTGYVDPAGAPYVYKLTAVDLHGNESPAAVVALSGAAAVDGGTPRTLAFSLVSANPSREGAVMRFALPEAGAVRIAIYDAAGREVRMLTGGDWPAGDWSVRWDGASDRGASLPSGLYFARFSAEGRELVKRIVLSR